MAKNKYSKDIINILLLAVIFVLYFILRSFNYANVIGNIVRINNPIFFNNTASKTINLVLLLAFIILLIRYLYAKSGYDYIKNLSDAIYGKIEFIFSLKTLLIILIVYLVTLSIIAIKNYDLGIDESFYIICSKNFYSKFSSFVTYNDSFNLLDYFSLLPLYLAAMLNYLTGLTELWHFKLLSGVLSLISIIIIYVILHKAYNKNVAVIFLLLLTIQPGFGYVSFSFFGEIVQAALFFGALYYWLQDKKPVDIKKILIVSILFSLSIHAKFQLLYAIIPATLIFTFIDKSKKPISILFFTIAFIAIIMLVRMIPSIINHKIDLHDFISYWFLRANSNSDIMRDVFNRMHLFNNFFSLPLLLIFLGIFVLFMKTEFDKYLLIFTCLNIFWWIFLWKTSPYRIFFIVIIPSILIISICIYNIYDSFKSKINTGFKSLKLVIFIVTVSILFYGIYTNISYALIGYSDGVQFDLDGTKYISFNSLKHDITQKDFYSEVEKIVSPNDSIYISSVISQALTVTQFYLPQNHVYEFEYLKRHLDLSKQNKFVIVDRVSYPVDINEGRKLLDSLNVTKTLVLKKGEYELYSVSKK